MLHGGRCVEVSQLVPDQDKNLATLVTALFLQQGEVVFIQSLKPLPGRLLSKHHLTYIKMLFETFVIYLLLLVFNKDMLMIWYNETFKEEAESTGKVVSV